MGKELVDGIEGVGLNSIVGSVDNKLRDIRLPGSKSQQSAQLSNELRWNVFIMRVLFTQGTRTKT